MARKSHDKHEAGVDQAKRDMDRLHQQSEKLINPMGDREYDPNDPAEKWGRILGRGLGYLVAGYLLYHLITTYVL